MADNNKTMLTKSQLIENLAASQSYLTPHDVDESANKILEHIASAMGRGDRIEIRGFGSFSSRFRESRIARNPKTGATFKLQNKSVPYFRAGKNLREKVNASTITTTTFTSSSNLSLFPDD